MLELSMKIFFYNLGARYDTNQAAQPHRLYKLRKETTVKILNFPTDMFRQTVQTQIRLLLEEQSDQGLHCLLFHLHHLEVKSKVEPLSLNLRVLTVKLVGVRKLSITQTCPCNIQQF